MQELSKIWKGDQWLNENQVSQVLKFGYYSKPMGHNPKGRVISLNTNAAYDVNYRLVKDAFDPGHMIQWLENELQTLEDNDGFAYIIGHVPPNLFLYEFGHRYQALMERYQHVIRFQSFGHTHGEEI
jgi:hypothetical protein